MIERKILITHKNVNKRAYWLVKNTPHFYLNLNLNLRNAQLASFFSALFLLLIGSGPKKSMDLGQARALCYMYIYIYSLSHRKCGVRGYIHDLFVSKPERARYERVRAFDTNNE